MPELEDKIAAWRARLSAVLPNQEKTVRELEEHLRDHIDVLRGRGVSADEAFALGVARLGDVRAIARAFDQTKSPWTAASRSVAVIVVMLAALMALMFAALVRGYFRGTIDALRGVHTLVLGAGYVSVFAAGLIGACTLLLAWWRPLAEGERRVLRQAIFRLALAGCALVPMGIVLGMLWAAENLGRAWSWDRVEIGALSVLAATVFLFVVQLRVAGSGRTRWLLAALGGIILGFGWVCGGALTAVVPISWLCGAFVAGQAAIALLGTGESGGDKLGAAECRAA